MNDRLTIGDIVRNQLAMIGNAIEETVGLCAENCGCDGDMPCGTPNEDCEVATLRKCANCDNDVWLPILYKDQIFIHCNCCDGE